MTEDINFLDTQQAARFLGLSAKTLARYRVTGEEDAGRLQRPRVRRARQGCAGVPGGRGRSGRTGDRAGDHGHDLRRSGGSRCGLPGGERHRYVGPLDADVDGPVPGRQPDELAPDRLGDGGPAGLVVRQQQPGLRFGDLGLEPPERGGSHRLRGEMPDKLLARAGLEKKTDIWASAEPPYFLVTVIYLRGSCLVRAEQLGLQDLIALAAAPLPAPRLGVRDRRARAGDPVSPAECPGDAGLRRRGGARLAGEPGDLAGARGAGAGGRRGGARPTGFRPRPVRRSGRRCAARPRADAPWSSPPHGPRSHPGAGRC